MSLSTTGIVEYILQSRVKIDLVPVAAEMGAHNIA